jgi:2C-methyl-D-erythritol 2,4-cyclodiphosphate synthase
MSVVLGPHFVERNLDTREYLQIIRHNVVQRDFRVHNIDIGMTCGGSKMKLLLIPATL